MRGGAAASLPCSGGGGSSTERRGRRPVPRTLTFEQTVADLTNSDVDAATARGASAEKSRRFPKPRFHWPAVLDTDDRVRTKRSAPS